MAQFNDIVQAINGAIADFNDTIPASQRSILNSILVELKDLDLSSNGDIKTSVANLKTIGKIKSGLQGIILTDKYTQNVYDFVDNFLTVANLQNQYWQTIQSEFKPGPLLAEIKTQAITDTVSTLTDNGIAANIADSLTNVLQTAVTSGGSYADLADQLRIMLTDQKDSQGLLSQYAKTYTVDALSTFSRQYTQAIADEYGYEWFAYQGSDIETTRPFCDAMTDFTYFHVSEIPRLLAAENLYYTNKKTGRRELVPIYPKTGLPAGLKANTNPENFRSLAGGWNCPHQIRPVSAGQVPLEIKDRVNGKPTLNAGIKDTETLFKNKDGKYTPERDALHQKIIDGWIAKGSTKTGTVFALGGAPANGKSTLVKSKKIPTPEGIATLDPDAIKQQLPEYEAMVNAKDPRAAAFVHEESSYISKEIVKKALAQDFDLISDGVGDGKLADVQKKVKQYHDAGKRVRADYVTLDSDLSLKLAEARAKVTGREVPRKYIMDMNEEISKLIPQIIKDHTFDELYLWDTNDVSKPRLILSQSNGILSIEDKELYNRFLLKSGEPLPVETKPVLSLDDATSAMLNKYQPTKAQKAVVKEYTDGQYQSFSIINDKMRTGAPLDPVQTQKVLDLKDFLGGAFGGEGTTYRGMEFGRIQYDDFVSKIKSSGGIIQDNGFMSTSKESDTVYAFLKGAPFRVIMTVEGKTGVPLTKFSKISDEKEVLFSPGSKFEIVDFKEDTSISDRTLLTLTVREL